jgi:hypothetical protein
MRLKETLLSIAIVIAFITYHIVTDPDSGIITDLPFGVTLAMSLEIFVTASLGFILIEIVAGVFRNSKVSEYELIEMALQSPEGAGKMFLAKAIYVLAYAIIVAASITGYYMH